MAVITCLLPMFAALADGSAQATPRSHARHNLAAQPNYMDACVQGGALSRECISQTVAAINNARTREHMRKHKLVLPSDYATLTRAEQVFVVINLERVDRGIRPIAGMEPLLNASAKLAAIVKDDPTPAILLLQHLGVHLFVTVWAQDYGVLASDYEWMYNDGWSGSRTTNVMCPYAGAPGCWGHRKGLLMRFNGLPLLLGGTGAARGPGGSDSVAAILSGGSGRAPHFTYTWRQALAHGADG